METIRKAGTGKPGAWLYTAARNACLNRLKHLQVEATNLEALREATRMDVATDYREHERLLQQAESIAQPTGTNLHGIAALLL